MRPDENRTCSIADGLLLIVGIAVSLGCVKATCSEDFLETITFPSPSPSWNFIGSLMELIVIFGVPALAAWTPLCLLLQAKKPRHRWRRLRRQPGFVANLLGSVVTALTVAAVAVCDLLSMWEGGVWFPNRYAKAYILISVLAGAAVLWSWAGLWVSGSLRRSPAWKDWFGLVNGAGWIVLGLICASFVYGKL